MPCKKKFYKSNSWVAHPSPQTAIAKPHDRRYNVVEVERTHERILHAFNAAIQRH